MAADCPYYPGEINDRLAIARAIARYAGPITKGSIFDAIAR